MYLNHQFGPFKRFLIGETSLSESANQFTRLFRWFLMVETPSGESIRVVEVPLDTSTFYIYIYICAIGRLNGGFTHLIISIEAARLHRLELC